MDGTSQRGMKSHVHHLMVGTWTPPGAIFTIKFDEQLGSLELVKRTAIPENEPISWMTFSHDRKTIYGAAMKKWSSFSVESPTDISHQVSHSLAGHSRASDADSRTRAIFVLAEKKVPHRVIGNPFYDYAGFANVFDVDAEGALNQNVQNFAYDKSSAIHGMVFDAAENYLYSADMWANKIWLHRRDQSSGFFQLVGSVTAPSADDHPRWVELHPSGNVLYALMESGNRLCSFDIDSETRMPTTTSSSYFLVPEPLLNDHPKMYRSDVVFLTSSARYLFASARSNSSTLSGFVTIFRLDDSGHISKMIQQLPTPTSGGHSNAVSPCPWSDEWVALCDDEQGWIEMYRWHDEQLTLTAHLDVKEPGFCMNAIWYD